jgi:acyl dehydratase
LAAALVLSSSGELGEGRECCRVIDQKFVGKEYPVTVYEIGREKMKEYAIAVGDMNPMYQDREAGKSSRYGDNIAPPNFAAVYNLMGCAQMFFDPELKLNFAMLVHGEQEFEFLKPVKPGDVITTTGKIVDIMAKGSNDIIVFEARSKNQDGDLVTVGRATFVIRGGN